MKRLTVASAIYGFLGALLLSDRRRLSCSRPVHSLSAIESSRVCWVRVLQNLP